ncbi:MAG: maltose ABC transporter substrate-binding protein [Anaerolineae bacterium]|nr:maltose ABC transporter substrate-binding protein [Anaerolineae bacterium]NUQ06156.1 maltose ABC transporter substrate-binding protein [Anaerolineae bacterium]
MKKLVFLVTVLLIAVLAGSVVQAQDLELTLWIYDDGRLEVLTQLGEAFEAEYGVGVSVEVVDLTEIRNAMTLGAASGEGPDMIIIPHDNLGPIVENGAALPIDLGDAAANYLTSAIDGFSYNGGLYGVPLAVENIGFFRNVDLVPEAPATWDDVEAVGAALLDSGDVDSAIGLPDLTYNSYPIFTSFGGYIFGRDATGSFTIEDVGMNNEGMVAGLTWIEHLIEEGLISANVDWEASHVQFETGRSAFILTGPWAINRFETAGVPYAISAFPAAEEGGAPGYPFLGVQGLVVNANSEDAILAQTFAVDFLATEEHYQMIFDAEPRPSAWASIFESASDPNTAGFNAAGANAVPMPSIPAMGYVWDAWVNAGALVAQGELSPQEALDSAVAQVLAQVAG